ncbi:MAG: phytoene/squalene synthase family protein [bacterium]|nr:MAG: phytoene/squalene synthase family protein [bacterium]
MNFWEQPDYKVSFEHVKLLTAHWSKSFYFSARFLPKEKRWATYALYGFCRYADNLIDNPRTRPKQQLLSEVACFRKELKLAYRWGESEHPILKPFILVAKKYGIPIEYPLDLLKGVQMDIEATRYETFSDLYVFCYRVASVVGLMMTHIMGYKDDQAFEYAEKLGIAMQLTNILRDVQEDKEMGRIYLPLEELQKFGITEDDVINEKFDEKFRRLIKFQVDRAHDYYEESSNGIPMLNTDSQFAIYSASKIYHGILRKIEARAYNPFLGRVHVPLGKKFLILMSEVLRTRVVMLKERLEI